jgi:hypothetical protein
MSLWAVVYINEPTKVVRGTEAPFEGDRIEDAEKEVALTYDMITTMSDREYITDRGWKLVPLTLELEEQYRQAE